MAFELTEGYLDLTARTNKFSGQMQGVRGRLSKLGDKMRAVSLRAKIMFTAGAVAAGLYAKKLLTVSARLEETQAKFDTVFGAMKREANDWVDTYTSAVGRSSVEVKEWMARMQDTLVPMGMQRRQAFDLSKSLTSLAVDVASFNNEADATVIRDFTSAIVGNRMAVRKYGIILTNANQKQYMASKGYEKTYRQLTQIEKAMLTYNMILDSSADAMGDAIRTSASYTNQLKRLRSIITDNSARLGDELLPAATKVVSKLTEVVPKMTKWVIENKRLLLTIGEITAGVVGFVAVAPQLISLIGTLTIAVTKLNFVMTAAGTAAAPWLTTVTLLAAAGFTLYTVWTKVSDAMNKQRKITEELLTQTNKLANEKERLNKLNKQFLDDSANITMKQMLERDKAAVDVAEREMKIYEKRKRKQELQIKHQQEKLKEAQPWTMHTGMGVGVPMGGNKEEINQLKKNIALKKEGLKWLEKQRQEQVRVVKQLKVQVKQTEEFIEGKDEAAFRDKMRRQIREAREKSRVELQEYTATQKQKELLDADAKHRALAETIRQAYKEGEARQEVMTQLEERTAEIKDGIEQKYRDKRLKAEEIIAKRKRDLEIEAIKYTEGRERASMMKLADRMNKLRKEGIISAQRAGDIARGRVKEIYGIEDAKEDGGETGQRTAVQFGGITSSWKQMASGFTRTNLVAKENKDANVSISAKMDKLLELMGVSEGVFA